MKKLSTYILRCAILLCILLLHEGTLRAQIVDANGQYQDTTFHDTINRQAEDFIEAYVSIAEPGDYLYTVLGHAAYHLKCPTFGLDYYFSMEGENSQEQVGKFLAGDLKMGTFAVSPEEYFKYYREEKRGVTEWKLNLSPEHKQKLWEVLDRHVTAGAHIPYDYYNRCCAITIINIMNEVVAPDSICYNNNWPDKFKKTPRELVIDAARDYQWTLFFMGILAGWDVDANIPNNRKFVIPMDDIEAWKEATIGGRTIITEEPIVVLESHLEPTKKSLITPTIVGFILLFLAVLSFASLWFKNTVIKSCCKGIDWTIGLLQMGIGFFMTYLLIISDLCCTGWNWYYIAVCPLPLFFWKWKRYWLIPYIAVLAIWTIVMIAYPHMIAQWSHILLTTAWIVVLTKIKLIDNNIDSKR